MRTCVGCRRRAVWTELVRCAAPAGGPPVISRGAAGRGAWVCAGSLDCFDRGVARRGFERAWRRPASPEELDCLRAAFAALVADVGTSRIERHTARAVAAPVKG